jgi:hypothetical protein
MNNACVRGAVARGDNGDPYRGVTRREMLLNLGQAQQQLGGWSFRHRLVPISAFVIDECLKALALEDSLGLGENRTASPSKAMRIWFSRGW